MEPFDLKNQQYQLIGNGEQMQLIRQACELTERLHAGQWFALEDILPRKKEFNIHRLEFLFRNHIEPYLDTTKYHFPRDYGDIMNVIRYRLAYDRRPEGDITVDFKTPHKFGKYPLMQIKNITPKTARTLGDIDNEIDRLEQRIKVLQEERREFINRRDLNKKDNRND